jgi:plastocyanin
MDRSTKTVLGIVAIVVSLLLLMGTTAFVFHTGGYMYGWGMMGGFNPGNGMMRNGGGMMGYPAPSGTPAVGVNQVLLTANDAFEPAIIQVPAGTTVTWKNTDTDAHTVTFMPMFANSGGMPQNAIFTFPFTTTGAYTYFCQYHQGMVGRVIVT